MGRGWKRWVKEVQASEGWIQGMRDGNGLFGALSQW